MSSEDDDGCVIRVRGLPWSTTAEEVYKFFEGANIQGGEDGVHFTFSREGRPSGEAFIEFETPDDVEVAMGKHNAHMGTRYLEVFRSKRSEMEWVIKRAGPNQHESLNEACVRLRGLPFGCSKEEIAQFFTGLEIVPNGIMLPEDRQGRSTGEAYVQFSNQSIAEKALGKHKERIGHRYIEIFKSSLSEAHSAIGNRNIRPLMGSSMGRPSPYDRNDRYGMGGGGGGMGMGMGGNFGRGRGRQIKGFYDDDFDDYNSGGYGSGMGGGFGSGGGGMNRRGGMRGRGGMNRMGGGGGGGSMNRMPGAQPGSQYQSKTGHSVHMRGLPFQALQSDIQDFFTPLRLVKVEFEYGPNNRPTGEANVDFETHPDAVEAMKKHKSNMQHRYIELFLNSTPGDNYSGGDNYSSSMGGMGNGASNNLSMGGGNSMGGGGGYGGGGGMNAYSGGYN
ncbi:hypothetical protein SNE40_019135 [Patella caerulea]|uniref:RRM domain-containing protein n=1 Tax=Patella caerulea TaxID=87958 RepID=A0AAN8J636_PATCE